MRANTHNYFLHRSLLDYGDVFIPRSRLKHNFLIIKLLCSLVVDNVFILIKQRLWSKQPDCSFV